MIVGDKITDCFMFGHGRNSNIGNPGVVEAVGRDWVVVRDEVNDEALFVDESPEELEQFLKEK